jgi:hypothetical protein
VTIVEELLAPLSVELDVSPLALAAESSVDAVESSLVAAESSLLAAESSLLAAESSVDAAESSLVAAESSLLAAESVAVSSVVASVFPDDEDDDVVPLTCATAVPVPSAGSSPRRICA